MITNKYNRRRTVKNVTSTGSLSDDFSRYHGIPIVPSPVVPLTNLVGRAANSDTLADIHAQVDMRMQTLRRQDYATLGEIRRLFGLPSGNNDTMRVDPQMVTIVVRVEHGTINIDIKITNPSGLGSRDL